MPIEMTCANCSEKFYCYPNEAERGRKYCSLACRSAHLHKRELAASRTPVDFVCQNCGKPFQMMQAYLTAYRKKFGKDPMYCSMTCSKEGRRRSSEERHKLICENCGKECVRSRKPGGRLYIGQKYCGPTCKAEAQSKRALVRFESGEVGRHVKRHGYVWLSIPALANGGKKTEVLEHRYVMAQHLGRALFPQETVHHINGNRGDNRLENLELFNSNHGPGQRVTDKVAFAIEILRLYPEFAKAAGVELRDVEH